jgi:hypothetical protein
VMLLLFLSSLHPPGGLGRAGGQGQEQEASRNE